MAAVIASVGVPEFFGFTDGGNIYSRGPSGLELDGSERTKNWGRQWLLTAERLLRPFEFAFTAHFISSDQFNFEPPSAGGTVAEERPYR